MSHTYAPTIPRPRRALMAAALVGALAVGALGAETADRLFDAPTAAADSIGTGRAAVEQARYDAYIQWLEDRAGGSRSRTP